MKLAEAIALNTSHRGGPTCRVATILTALSKADQADLKRALADKTVPSTAIARGLTAVGHQVAGGNVQRHRRADCSCRG